jgi:hypothetical protein
VIRRWAGCVVVAALLAALGPASAAAASPTRTNPPTVVVIGVPGLLWSDVASMPALRRLSAGSAVGELSVKTAGGVTRCAAGLLAASAGNRTGSPTSECLIPPAAWASLAHANRTSRYGATLGLLGAVLHQHGIDTVAVGVAATPLVADEQGHVDRVVPRLSPRIAGAAPAVVGVLIPGLYDASGADRVAAQRSVDGQVARDLSLAPAGATVIVAGISDAATGHANLHALIVHGPQWRHTQLTASAAGRVPYVQLIDLAPTVLGTFGVPVPQAMIGQPVRQTGSPVPAISSYVDDNRHATAQRTLGQRTFLALGLAAILLMLLAAAGRPDTKAVGTGLARLLAPAPMVGFVANALPWWRWGQPAYAGIVIAGCVVVAIVTTAVARRHPAVALLVPTASSFVALALDQLTGAQLQFSAPMGDSPLIAGRFSGVGNLDFAVIATSALLAAAVAGGLIAGRRGAGLAGLVALAAVVIDGAPQLGDDVGGVLALVPAALVLVAGVLKVRVSRGRIALAALAAIVVAVVVAIGDYARPASRQTHVGRFVGQVLHGGAVTEVHRKLDAMLGSFALTIGMFVTLVAIILAVACRRRVWAAVQSLPGLAAGGVAATVGAVLGVLLNDSGVTIAAMAVIVGFSAVYGAGLPQPQDRAGGRH